MSDYKNLPSCLTCENCHLKFPKAHLREGYEIDHKKWCRDCRLGMNYVVNKCDCGKLRCYCRIGFPYELLCLKCRDDRYPGDIHLFCVCPPNEDVFDRWQLEN